MGIDRGLAKGFGFMVLGVVAIGALSLALLGLFTPNREVVAMVVPVVAVYSGILAVAALGIAGYAFLSTRRQTD